MRVLFKFFYTFPLLFLPLFLCAQSSNDDKPKVNWFNLDLISDGTFGISTEKAYKELLLKMKASPVIVAVIDGGIDEEHEDLKSVMWVNEKEIPANSIDDDNNGYVDDIYGWNFIGSAKGNIHHDNMELIRFINKFSPKYASALNSTPFNVAERKEFQLYQKLIAEYMDKLQSAQMGLQNTTMIRKYLDEVLSALNTATPSLEELSSFKPTNDMQERVIKFIKPELKDKNFKEFYEELVDGIKYYDTQVKYQLNVDFDPRKDSVGDDYLNSNERFYGNNDITGPDADHGTHVAGIIGAIRSNSLGIKGVSDQVKIMGIRIVPDGDERDKDVANSIRYAVDNGAKILNMSFGKAYSWDKKVVDDAIRYAVSKGVLLVHAAGNDSKNIDKTDNFPSKFYTDSSGVKMGTAEAWIEVGATSWINDENLVATFSNFGAKTVDVFAPGVKINSTMPGSTYKDNDGTSMAAPVVSGLAALIWAYYPKFTAVEIKDIIMNSVTKVQQKVKIIEDDDNKRVYLNEISISGGVVNAYNALQLAAKRYTTLKAK
jgi:subtilisin family serine protease